MFYSFPTFIIRILKYYQDCSFFKDKFYLALILGIVAHPVEGNLVPQTLLHVLILTPNRDQV